MIENIKEIYKRIINSKFVQTSFFNGLANIVRIITGIISNKIISVILGPSGMALIGQFANYTSLVTTFANLGMSSGVIKYTAEYKEDEDKRNALLSTSFYLIISATIIASLFVIFTSSYFAETLLFSKDYTVVFMLFGFTLILFTVNAYLGNLLNGFKEFKPIIRINIYTSIIGLIITILLVFLFNVVGALISSILSQSIIVFITLHYVLKSDWFNVKIFYKYFDKRHILPLFKFSIMAFTSMFAVTFIQLKVRNFIIDTISIEDAGYWQGLLKVTDLYIGFITMTLSIYILPRLSELKKSKELKNEILKSYKLLLPVTIIASLIIYVFKGYIIDALFSPAFRPMESLFLFQLIGNVIKIASWILGVLLWARAMTVVFIITELSFGISNYLLNIYFVSNYGIIGSTYAYSLNYLIYFFVMSTIFFFYFKKMSYNEKIFEEQSKKCNL